ncbi:MAG: hypothetical protein IKQ61_04885 [Spirochaetales bacterium]|nr:hypothetical protein [Spirochaetales bacterium]MBR6062391.1 hypothetical protein [Spirochaetales bacterium]MBR6199582.1 hypothetical protein [Spirochaetales bacterium]
MNQEDIQKINDLREKMTRTYRLAVSEEQRKRIGKYIKDLDIIIGDIKAGRPVDPVKLRILDDTPSQKLSKNTDDRLSFSDIIEVETVIASEHDYDFDQIYAFLTFFENHLSPALSASYLKLDFALAKKRDECLMNYESVKRIVDQYVSDFNQYYSSHNDNTSMRERLRTDRRSVLVKLNDTFVSIRKFFVFLVNDLDDGRNSILNKDSVFRDKFSTASNYFNGKTYEDIVRLALQFVNEMIDVIDIPRF